MQLFQELALADFQFLADEVFRAVDRVAEHIGNGEELWLVVFDDTAVRRYVYFAVGEGIECVEGLIAGDTRRQTHLYLHLGSGEVLHMAGFNLALVDRLQDGVDDGLGGLGKRYLTDDKCLGVKFLNLRAYLKTTTTRAIVVLRHIDGASCGEVGIELEGLVVKVADGCIADFHEVMRQDL